MSRIGPNLIIRDNHLKNLIFPLEKRQIHDSIGRRKTHLIHLRINGVRRINFTSYYRMMNTVPRDYDSSRWEYYCSMILTKAGGKSRKPPLVGMFTRSNDGFTPQRKITGAGWSGRRIARSGPIPLRYGSADCISPSGRNATASRS